MKNFGLRLLQLIWFFGVVILIILLLIPAIIYWLFTGIDIDERFFDFMDKFKPIK